ncbi:very short patch repair endonuclease [Arthrobacter sp. MDT3-44]
MTDRLTREQRSANMAKIRATNTKPEMQVRRMIHRAGYRYLLHDKRLPGKPDLVFPGRRKVIFVHGCFWHEHSCRIGQRSPKTNAAFWSAKRLRNVKRDREQLRDLEVLGWSVHVIWECELKYPDEVLKEVTVFLS